MTTPPKILYLVTEDWYFCSHRLPHAIAAMQAGYVVTVATRVRLHGDLITAAGIRLIPLAWSRRERNPFRALQDLWQVYRIIRAEQPDLLHNVALKPVLYGSLAAAWGGVSRVVNALAGLGSLYTSDRLRLRLLRILLSPLLHALLSRAGTRVIFQNPDDLAVLTHQAGIPARQAVLIRGAGVDTDQLVPVPEPDAPPVLVLLAARMLWSKGIGEFVAAARILKERGHDGIRFVLVGESDPDNPDAISLAHLTDWQASGIVEWWGHCSDMPAVLGRSHIVCLPSTYGEGIPRILLEAAAAGRPIITTDWPGCREVVRHGHNGLLVPPRDPAALAEAVATLGRDPEQRRDMGHRGRQIAIREFTLTHVVAEILTVYGALLALPDSEL